MKLGMTEETVKFAREMFSKNYNCAQASMKAILTVRGLDFDQLLHLAGGLGAGIAHEGNVCGAVTGSIAALGVIEGRYHSDDIEQKEAAYAKGEEFIRKFKQKHGSILCNDLTGIEMRDLKARKIAMENGTFNRSCPSFVEDAIRIALEIATK